MGLWFYLLFMLMPGSLFMVESGAFWNLSLPPEIGCFFPTVIPTWHGLARFPCDLLLVRARGVG